MTTWKPGSWERIKSRAIGTFVLSSDKSYGESGPGTKDIGYVVGENFNNSFGEHEKFYTIFFEDFPGRYFIGFDYSGTFTPFQEPLFTTEK